MDWSVGEVSKSYDESELGEPFGDYGFCVETKAEYDGFVYTVVNRTRFSMGGDFFDVKGKPLFLISLKREYEPFSIVFPKDLDKSKEISLCYTDELPEEEQEEMNKVRCYLAGYVSGVFVDELSEDLNCSVLNQLIDWTDDCERKSYNSGFQDGFISRKPTPNHVFESDKTGLDAKDLRFYNEFKEASLSGSESDKDDDKSWVEIEWDED